MGAHAHFDPGQKDLPFEEKKLMVSLLLSVQTNDKTTDSVFRKMFQKIHSLD